MNAERWVRGRLASRTVVDDIAQRVVDLERDVAELREQNLRLAEIADVVQELLIPMAARDQDRIDAAIARFAGGL